MYIFSGSFSLFLVGRYGVKALFRITSALDRAQVSPSVWKWTMESCAAPFALVDQLSITSSRI